MRFQSPWPVAKHPVIALALVASILSTAQAQTDLPTLTATSDDALPTGAAATSDASSGTKASGTKASSTDGSAAATTDSAAATSETAAATSLGDLPALSTSDAAVPTLTGLPSLSGAFNYPAPTVPPTANAPYMQRSNLPEGTVFICVGAALAFIGLVMVAWRIVVSWMVNRSVKKAAMTQYSRETKAMMDVDRKSHFYSHSPESSMSMERLTRTGRPMSTAPTKIAPNTSLFFSPTSGAGIHSIGNRNSSGYLPAGYYSVGNAAAGNGMPTPQIGGSRRPPTESMTNAPAPARYEDSPQHSPELGPSRLGPYDSVSNLSTNISTNVSSTQGTRTPSNYLDDLMSAPPLPPPRSGPSRPQSDYRGR